jgi:hypothetical protein
MPSFTNTFRRCHSTVRGLRKSCAPISGVRQAVAREPGDLFLLRGELIARVVAALSHVLAGGDQLAARTLGERLHPDADEHVVSRTQLVAGVEAASLAAQPLPVQQVRAGKLRAQPGAAQPLDRLAVEGVGRRTDAEQRAAACLEAESHVGTGWPGRFRQPFERVARTLRHTRARGRLDQFGQRPHRDERFEAVRGGVPGRCRRLLVSAEAVVQDRGRPVRVDRRQPPTRWRCERVRVSRILVSNRGPGASSRPRSATGGPAYFRIGRRSSSRSKRCQM